MCDRGTPIRRIAACTCWRPTVLYAVAVVAAGAVVARAGVLEAVVIAAMVVAAALVALTVWRLQRSGVRLVHRTTQPPARIQEQPDPVQPAEEVPWYERARIGERP